MLPAMPLQKLLNVGILHFDAEIGILAVVVPKDRVRQGRERNVLLLVSMGNALLQRFGCYQSKLNERQAETPRTLLPNMSHVEVRFYREKLSPVSRRQQLG